MTKRSLVDDDEQNLHNLKARIAQLEEANRALAREVQERKQIEKALHESERKFHDIARNIPGLVFQFRVRSDGSTYFSYTSPRGGELLGLPADQSSPDWELGTLVHPEDRALFFASITQAIEKRSNWDHVGRIITQAGELRWFQGISSPTQIGDELVFDGILLDITERKQVEAWIEGLNRLKEDLLGPNGLKKKLTRITDGAVEIFQADFARIWITNPGDLCDSGCIHAMVTEGPHVCRFRDRCLHLVASSGRYTHTDGKVHRRVPFGAYKIGRVAAGTEVRFVTNDVTHDPRVHDRDWARELGLVSFAGYRLLSADGEPIGVLSLFSKQTISPEKNALLESLANSTAQVIQTTKAEEALKRSEKERATILDSMSEHVVYQDTEMRVLWANRVAGESVGLTPEQLAGHRCYEIWHQRDEPCVGCPVEKARETGQPQTKEMTSPDERVWRVRGYPVQDADGQVVGVVEVTLEITARKQAEAERERLIHELQQALTRVKMLSGLLPICMNCKKIRDDAGYWQDVAIYVRDHSEAEFTHGICPDCERELYPPTKYPYLYDDDE